MTRNDAYLPRLSGKCEHAWPCRATPLTHVLLVGLCCAVASAQEQGARDERERFFESRIRPVLVEHCYACHNSTREAAGSLALDHRAGLLKGGDGGKIVVPGSPGQSRLLAILRHEVSGLKMPQDGAKLEADVIADFERWIALGALDPRDAPPSADELEKATSWEAKFAKRRKWWSFQPPVKPEEPVVKNTEWSAHPVDRFLLGAMERQGLTPASDASKRTLLRRVSFVLTGLPPTPKEIHTFLADESDTAYEDEVDRLLDSPRFGERWARHWMDLVRYCESHGSQADPELANAYRYRDYLIRAFNRDVPYDQLVREQIAGDLLPEPRWNDKEQINESAIGPAHLRMVELGFIPIDALGDQVKVVDNQIDVYSKAFLGLTASCARCHHHKFDPISQEDFYALYGIFASCRPGHVVIDSPEVLDRNRDELTRLEQTIRDELAQGWLDSVETFGTRLQHEMQRAARVADFETRLAKTTQAIAAIEEPARVLVLEGRQDPAQRGSGSAATVKSALAPERRRPASRSGLQGLPTLPAPFARWSFDGDARDSGGGHHGELLDGAVIRDGRLILDGIRASMRTVPLDRDIREKTLEAWLSLSRINQSGGGVVGIDTPDRRFFDSIVYGEINARSWMAGSEGFHRSQDPGGPEEIAPNKLIHIAIVYAPDNSITLYRNGERYGKPYRKGTLYPFLKNKAKFLFGQRVTGTNPPLRGEVEEARVYTRPLTSAEVRASYRGGPAGVSAEEIAAVLDVEQRDRFASLHAEESRLREELDSLESTEEDPWIAAFDDARDNKANPLHLWFRFVTDDPPSSVTGWRDRWEKLVEFWQAELQSRREFNQTRFTPVWDSRTEQNDVWFRFGQGLSTSSESAVANGSFHIEPDGKRVLKGIYSAGLFSHAISNRHAGLLTSPRFAIDTNNISVRALGQNSRIRVVIENYPNPLGGGAIYPEALLKQDDFGWFKLDTSRRIGSRAYIEVVTDLKDRAYFGATRVVTSNRGETPRETTIPIAPLLQGAVPTSPDDLAARYSERLQTAIHSWQTRSGTHDETALLNFFVQRDLLPTTLDALPELREPVARYRQLEAEIPVPRRAPGVIEKTGFDQPLFERGQHTRPGSPVPRRGLSLFGSAPALLAESPRLQLAEQTASATNPLTARVLVNRLWHYVFGRGIVATVDNFGHLGARPTHPKLLDDLAVRFVENGWSIKSMLRLLVTSRAFRQSSVASDTAMRVDPENLYLSHVPVRRLDADAIRDSILATSGQLDLRMYGRGVDVYHVKKTDGGGPRGPLDGNGRRSVYLRIRRNAHNPFLEAFDAPKPSTTRGRRDVTNVPAQSLTMLNDPFVIDQADKWAKRLLDSEHDSAERVRVMYERAFARNPTDEELQATLEYATRLFAEHVNAADESTRQQLVWRDVAHALFCLKEFIYVE